MSKEEAKLSKDEYLEKLFTIQRKEQEKALKLYHDKKVNGLTLQLVDESFRTACPKFYQRRLIKILGDFERPNKVNERRFFEQLPQEWRLLYFGILPRYYAYGWPWQESRLIKELKNLNRYLRFPRETQSKLRKILDEETHSYKESYNKKRTQLEERLSQRKLGKVEGLIICFYQAY